MASLKHTLYSILIATRTYGGAYGSTRRTKKLWFFLPLPMVHKSANKIFSFVLPKVPYTYKKLRKQDFTRQGNQQSFCANVTRKDIITIKAYG